VCMRLQLIAFVPLGHRAIIEVGVGLEPT
jgi:hypothetical protein